MWVIEAGISLHVGFHMLWVFAECFAAFLHVGIMNKFIKLKDNAVIS